jgi:Na+-driven multidrug efflux pump
MSPLLAGPILPTLARLALPNMAAMLATAAVAIAETAYVGLLGTPSLAGLALVFPMVMLMQTMSAGAMGGGVSSAIARALGAGEEARASALALHALVIGAPWRGSPSRSCCSHSGRRSIACSAAMELRSRRRSSTRGSS